MYLIVDMNSDYKEIMDYKGAKNLLIDTVQNDLLMNCSDYDVSKYCSDILSKLAKEDFTKEDYIKEELLSYSYKTIDLLDIQRDLEDLKEYFAPNDDTTLAIDFKSVIDKINKGVK